MSNSSAIYNLLVHSAEKFSKLPAIHDEHGSLTFDGLLKEVDHLKRHLQDRGIGSGQGVGVMARNSREFIITVFAVLGCGAAVMPVSHQLKRPEIDEIIEKAGLHFILDDLSGIVPLENSSIEILLVGEREIRLGRTRTAMNKIFASHVSKPAFVRFTSGTTGTSKGVVIDEEGVLGRTESANKALDLGPGSNVMWVLPMAYHFVVSIVLYVRYGASIIISKDFMARSVLEMSNKYSGTLLYASPMQIRLLAADQSGMMLPDMKKVISTSSGLNSDISNAFNDRFNIPVHQAFGIIEVGLPIINDERGEDAVDAVGFVLPDYDVKIFNDSYQVVPDGEIGLLGIKGPGIFAAYLDPPVVREEVLINGYFFSADYASIDKDGLVRIQGRKKSMINVSGNKVFAEEVEAVLEQLPIIRQARVSGVPHPLMGQIIQAEVVLEGDTEIDVEATLKFCRDRLSTFKIPQKVIIVDELEMTNSGKVKRS